MQHQLDDTDQCLDGQESRVKRSFTSDTCVKMPLVGLLGLLGGFCHFLSSSFKHVSFRQFQVTKMEVRISCMDTACKPTARIAFEISVPYFFLVVVSVSRE